MTQQVVFIDRDGVINRDGWGRTRHGYITRWEDWEFIPGVLEAFRLFTEAGYTTVIISNQKCVARGLLSERELSELTEKYKNAIKESGGRVDRVYYCVHSDEDRCTCRKPAEGLFLRAARDLGIESFDGKYMIGDSERDMAAGRKAGLRNILVLTGKSSADDARRWENKPDLICKDLLEAAETVISEA
ncbi:MAG: HAD-IIIA family hydrolase [Candidatus Omnitrophica bacterium]|nr:HAD-IIIA family hydrolase [Candidatus Omnitrophota bacterium]